MIAVCACSESSDTVELKCGWGGETIYNVVAEVFEDRVELEINGNKFVLPKDPSFFENADASYLSEDIETGFVINHNDEFFQEHGYGKYLLKVNGNEYSRCEEK